MWMMLLIEMPKIEFDWLWPFSFILTITIFTISFNSSRQRVEGMLRVLKKSLRMRSTQLLRSSPKKSLRSWRCALTWYFSCQIFLTFSLHRWWGWRAIWKKNCDTCCEWFCNSFWYMYLFHKKILKYTYLRYFCFDLHWQSPAILLSAYLLEENPK